jgi:hypothetical protein
MYTICTITAYFVRSNYRNCSLLLGIKRIREAYSREKIIEAMIPVLEEFKLKLNLGVFVTNNIDSNNSAIKVILIILRLDFNARIYRSRYLSYIINLAVKAFIFN